MTHRGSWTATEAVCGEQWPHTACWELPDPALSSRKCVFSPRGGWRYAGGAPYGENMLLDLAWHSWYSLLPWGCLRRTGEGKVERKQFLSTYSNSVWTACFHSESWTLNSVMFTVVSTCISKNCSRAQCVLMQYALHFYVPIFMSLSWLPLTHRGDITILFFSWLPSMHHIHPSPLDGGGSLQHCRQSNIRT